VRLLLSGKKGMVPGFPLASCVSHQFFTMETYGALRARNFCGIFPSHTLCSTQTHPFFPLCCVSHHQNYTCVLKETMRVVVATLISMAASASAFGTLMWIVVTSLIHVNLR